jgi:hypothetical protein
MEDQQKATKVTLYLPQELHKQLKIRSAIDGEPMSTLAERALGFYLAHADVVEEYSEFGQTHRVYHCPTCSDSVVMREGDLVSMKSVISSEPTHDLCVEVPGVVLEGSRPEEGQTGSLLVGCVGCS